MAFSSVPSRKRRLPIHVCVGEKLGLRVTSWAEDTKSTISSPQNHKVRGVHDLTLQMKNLRPVMGPNWLEVARRIWGDPRAAGRAPALGSQCLQASPRRGRILDFVFLTTFVPAAQASLPRPRRARPPASWSEVPASKLAERTSTFETNYHRLHRWTRGEEDAIYR